MNLIKRHGYEKARSLSMSQVGLKKDMSDLQRQLLQHRRENNIFEVGDKVVLNRYSGDFARDHDDIYKIVSFENDLETQVLLSHSVRSSTQHIIHATDAEIEAGHRL